MTTPPTISNAAPVFCGRCGDLIGFVAPDDDAGRAQIVAEHCALYHSDEAPAPNQPGVGQC